VLLSFVASEAIALGDAVTISTTTSGQILPAHPSGIPSATVIGVSIDAAAAGTLCRVVSDAAAPAYTGLNPGHRYFVSPSGGYVVDYDTFITEFNQIGVSGSYLTHLGTAISSTTLRVSPVEPKYVVSGAL
jgi:hypothetical protein